MWAQLANVSTRTVMAPRASTSGLAAGRPNRAETYLPTCSEPWQAGKTLTANPTCRYRSTATWLRCDCTQLDPADLRIGGSANPQEFEDANYQ